VNRPRAPHNGAPVDDVPQKLDFAGAERLHWVVEPGEEGRLDHFLARRMPAFTRAAIQRICHRDAVLLAGRPAKPSARVRPGDRVEVEVPRIVPPSVDPEDLPVTVLLEEASFAVLDKAPGMAVHPGRGRQSGTLANAIAHRFGALSLAAGVYRPGIVHRLDLDTSGVMVIARTERAHAQLSDAFRARTVRKEYRALVHGDPPYDEERIDAPLGRDPRNAKRMAVRHDGGRAAVTEARVLERFGPGASLLFRPLTGRTHQIRVHAASRGYPILGDVLYSGGKPDPIPAPRVLLHAHRLVFPHPETGAEVEVTAPLPADFVSALEALRAARD